MLQDLLSTSPRSLRTAVSPLLERGAYEALWAEEGATQKRAADQFRARLGSLPSENVSRETALEMASRVMSAHESRGVRRFGVRVHQAVDYPRKLRDARHPVEVLQQDSIARNHLLISEIPVVRYFQQDWRTNRGWFPQRNATMSALTEATIIVEASETSGTLTQARAALYQAENSSF